MVGRTPGEEGDVQSVAVAEDGRVFYVADNQPGTMEETSVPRYHYLYAVDLDDGETLWTVELPTDTGSGGIAATDRTVYITTGNGQLLAFDARSGQRSWVWSADTTDGGYTPVVVQDVVYAQTGGHLAAIEAEDGRLRWRQDGPFHDAPVVGGDALYCATKRDLVAFDTVTGRRRWRSVLPKWYGEPLGATAETAFVAVEYDDRVEVLGFHAGSGCRLGSYEVRANVVTPVADSGTTLFFGGHGGDGGLSAITRPGRRDT